MAVLFDGFDNLAGKGLPNVKIEDIHLSVAQDPEPESNPHINSIREVVATGTSNNKLIQNASPSLAKKQLVNKDFYLDLTLSILNIESFGNSLILNQVNYLDFVYVKVIQSLSKNLTNELFTKDFPVDYTKLKNVDFEMRKSWLGDNKKLHYVEIIEMIKWYSNIEKNLLPNAKKINMSKFVKKDFDDFTKHVKITNKSILEKIIDEYNTRNKIKLDLLPKAINDYCKKIKNNV